MYPIEVHVTTYNRKAVTQRCLERLVKLAGQGHLHLWDDWSTEYDLDWLRQFTPNVHRLGAKMNNARLKAFALDWFDKKSFLPYCYFTENDDFHAMGSFDIAMCLLNRGCGTLFRSSGHEASIYEMDSIAGKTRTISGGSVFFHREHVGIVQQALELGKDLGWDWHLNNMIRSWWVPRNSWIQHLWRGGMHAHVPEKEQDVAINPVLELMEVTP